MPLRPSILAAVVSAILVLVVIELIRTRRLQERYALLWLTTGTLLTVLGLWRGGLERVSSLMGIAYPPSALFVLGFLFILVVLLHYSTAISRLSDENKIVAQRLALLEAELRHDLAPRAAETASELEEAEATSLTPSEGLIR